MRRSRSIGNGSDAAAAGRPAPPVSKRQRMMMDEFENMSLTPTNHNEENNNMKLPPSNVAIHDSSSWTTEGDTMSDDDEAMSAGSSSQDETLSALQQAERNIVYQLALGRAPETARKDPVDRKLEEMIRRSRLNSISQQTKAKDDFDIQTPYTRGTMQQDEGMLSSAAARQRSNSLPRDWDGSMQTDGSSSMDVDMMMMPRQSQRPALNQQQDASPLVVARSQLISTRNATTAVTTSNTGRWETRERLAFLRGLRLYGRGNWKQISKMISTRTTIQVKSHAQVVLKKMDQGQDVFAELDRHERLAAAGGDDDLDDADGSSMDTTPEDLSNVDAKDMNAAHALVLLMHE